MAVSLDYPLPLPVFMCKSQEEKRENTLSPGSLRAEIDCTAIDNSGPPIMPHLHSPPPFVFQITLKRVLGGRSNEGYHKNLNHFRGIPFMTNVFVILNSVNPPLGLEMATAPHPLNYVPH